MKISDRLPLLLVVAVVILGGGVVASRFFSDATGTTTVEVYVPPLSPTALRGKSAYDANCLQCHGPNGAGSDQGPPFVHDIYNPGHHANPAFYFAAERGVPSHHWNFGDMPAQPQVSREELAVIVRYIRELQEANGIFYKPHQM